MPRDARQDLVDSLVLAWFLMPVLWVITIRVCAHAVLLGWSYVSGGNLASSSPAGEVAFLVFTSLFIFSAGGVISQSEAPKRPIRATFILLPTILLTYWTYSGLFRHAASALGVINIVLLTNLPLAAFLGGELGSWMFRTGRLKGRRERRERERLRNINLSDETDSEVRSRL